MNWAIWNQSTLYLPVYRSIVILSSNLRTGLQVVSFLQVSSPQPCMCFSSPRACHMLFPSYFLNNIWWVQTMKLLIMQFVPSSYYSFLSTLFVNIPSLCSSLNVGDQGLYMHTIGQITALHYSAVWDQNGRLQALFSARGKRIVCFLKRPDRVWGPTYRLVQWVPCALCTELDSF